MTDSNKNFLLSHAFIATGMILLLPAYWAYRMALGTPDFKTDACVVAIVTGLGATICLAGAMIFLSKPLAEETPPVWYVRLPLKIEKRVIVLLQLVTMGLALGGAAVLIFNLPVPALF